MSGLPQSPTPLPFWHWVLINELPSSNWLILIFDSCQKVLRRRKRLSDNYLMAFRPYRLKMCRFRRLWTELLLISISFSGPKTREALVTGCTLQTHGLKLRPPLGWFIWPSPHQTWNWPHGHSIWPFIKRIAPTVLVVDLLPARTTISFGISLGEGTKSFLPFPWKLAAKMSKLTLNSLLAHCIYLTWEICRKATITIAKKNFQQPTYSTLTIGTAIVKGRCD